MERNSWNNLIYYTDGACSGNPGPGGYGVVRLSIYYSAIYDDMIPRYDLKEVYSERFEKTTNNRMEMMAVIKVLELAAADPEHFYTIISDSAYVVNMCNDWIRGWARNGWRRTKNKPIENLDLVQRIWELTNRPFPNFEILKCTGHSGDLTNELADAVAANNKVKFWKIIEINKIFIDENVNIPENLKI